MPKPVRELEQRRRPLEERVLEFLVQDRENAYTLDEVISGVEFGSDQTQKSLFLLFLILAKGRGEGEEIRSRYREVLKNLITREHVRAFEEGQVTYYAAGPL